MNVPPLLLTNLHVATMDVFDTMVLKSVQARRPITDPSVRPLSQVVSTVPFTGYRCGLVSVHTSIATAREIAGAMLGQPPETIDTEFVDAVGEITNMIAGSFRTRMAETEPAWALGVPTVVVGSDFSTQYVANATRILCPFAMDDADVFVELILTAHPADGLTSATPGLRSALAQRLKAAQAQAQAQAQTVGTETM